MIRACYPGSFDPVTLGHLDLIERAARCCNELRVAVVHNPSKQTMFSLQEREELLRECAPEGVVIESFSGLLVHYLQRNQIQLVFRGLRDSADTALEVQMARLNREMYPQLETLWLASSGRLSHVSSSFVREIARLEGNFEALVDPKVARAVRSKLRGSVRP